MTAAPLSRVDQLRPPPHPRAEPAPSPDAGRASYIRELAPRAPATAGRRVVEALLAAGVDTFFGVPGGPISPLFEAVLSTEGATLIESRHESTAAFSAMGFYRATGRVPAVLVTAGPGATNAVTGVAAAFSERVPMLVICGDVAWASTGGRMAQDTGPEGVAAEQLFARITRAAVRASRPESAATQCLAALRAATAPLAEGPALFVVPMDIGRSPAPAAPPPALSSRFEVPAPAASVREAARMLSEARRPLVVIGEGARRHADAVRRLLDVLNVPFITTPQAKGVVSEAHPRSLRNGGLAASWWARRYTAEDVDVCLALGTDLDDSSTGPTRPVMPGGALIHVDLDPSVFHRNFPTTLPVLADLGAFARQLYDVVTAEGLRNPRGAALTRDARAESPFDTADFAADDSPRIAPHRAIADLERAAGPDARFVSDIGEHMLSALHYLTATGPERFTVHLGLGSMASGIASAIGQSLADRDRRVVCVCGDGGMQMAGMELLVAVKERLPIVYAVFNDARYNMVYHGFKQLYGADEAPEWETPWVDFAMWAKSFGAQGATIERPGEITAELLDRLTARGPAVLDIRIDRDRRIKGAGRNESLAHMSVRTRG